MSKPLLILELDETLLHVSEWPLALAEDFRLVESWVYLRPGIEAFLKVSSRHYRIAVWSSASDAYLNALVNQAILPIASPEFIWGRAQGIRNHGEEKILCVKEYRGDYDDHELPELQEQLEILAADTDVCRVEPQRPAAR